MGIIVVDWIIDVISILLVIGLVFLLEYDIIWQFVNEKVDFGKLVNLGNLMVMAVGVGVLGMVVLYFFCKLLF